MLKQNLVSLLLFALFCSALGLPGFHVKQQFLGEGHHKTLALEVLIERSELIELVSCTSRTRNGPFTSFSFPPTSVNVSMMPL